MNQLLVKNEVFNLKSAWRIVWNGVVPLTCWADKGGALAQLSLLKSGYSVVCEDASIRHIKPATRVEVK